MLIALVHTLFEGCVIAMLVPCITTTTSARVVICAIIRAAATFQLCFQLGARAMLIALVDTLVIGLVIVILIKCRDTTSIGTHVPTCATIRAAATFQLCFQLGAGAMLSALVATLVEGCVIMMLLPCITATTSARVVSCARIRAAATFQLCFQLCFQLGARAMLIALV